VRSTPLLLFLLCMMLHIDVQADALSTSTPAVAQELTTHTLRSQAVPVTTSGDNFAGPALEPSSTIAGTFDYSYFLVLCLGMAGLMWMRRQSQSL